jgi:hypothetical protein
MSDRLVSLNAWHGTILVHFLRLPLVGTPVTIVIAGVALMMYDAYRRTEPVTRACIFSFSIVPPEAQAYGWLAGCSREGCGNLFWSADEWTRSTCRSGA